MIVMVTTMIITEDSNMKHNGDSMRIVMLV
jgi:hypothetical protein